MPAGQGRGPLSAACRTEKRNACRTGLCEVAFHSVDYAIQEKPLIIMDNLESQAVFGGQDLILWCNVSLSNDYDVLFQWRHNQQHIQDGSQYSISNYENNKIVITELYIRNISISDEGNYECLVLDGLIDGGGAAFITVSDTAVIKVLGVYCAFKQGMFIAAVLFCWCFKCCIHSM